MYQSVEVLLEVILIGIGATLLIDLWAVILQRAFNVSSLNWSMVGRWIGHCFLGKFKHENISNAPVIKHEKGLGWGVHYGVGIGCAIVFVSSVGMQWVEQPTLLPALIFGVLSVALPFFIMQPCLGAGVAASKTPSPNIARLKSILTHMIFGGGLYLSALCVVLIG